MSPNPVLFYIFPNDYVCYVIQRGQSAAKTGSAFHLMSFSLSAKSSSRLPPMFTAAWYLHLLFHSPWSAKPLLLLLYSSCCCQHFTNLLRRISHNQIKPLCSLSHTYQNPPTTQTEKLSHTCLLFHTHSCGCICVFFTFTYFLIVFSLSSSSAPYFTVSCEVDPCRTGTAQH